MQHDEKSFIHHLDGRDQIGGTATVQPQACQVAEDLAFFMRFEGPCGFTACAQANFTFQEICNNKDDNCDGAIDNGPDSELCPDGGFCVYGDCIAIGF